MNYLHNLQKIFKQNICLQEHKINVKVKSQKIRKTLLRTPLLFKGIKKYKKSLLLGDKEV